jgi:hypothetical protein
MQENIHIFKGRTVEKHTMAAYVSAFYIPSVHSKTGEQCQSKNTSCPLPTYTKFSGHPEWHNSCKDYMMPKNKCLSLMLRL